MQVNRVVALHLKKESKTKLEAVAHAYNPSYARVLKPARANSS
jgi:hypothetical protein